MHQLGVGEGVMIGSIGVRGRPINGSKEGGQLGGIFPDGLLGLKGRPRLVRFVSAAKGEGGLG